MYQIASFFSGEHAPINCCRSMRICALIHFTILKLYFSMETSKILSWNTTLKDSTLKLQTDLPIDSFNQMDLFEQELQNEE